jgi:hypothetical protein
MSTSFDLHILGWKAFEDLVGCIFRDILGQTLQVFADGADGGRDAAFWGSWIQKDKSQAFLGSFCIQCKHTSKPSKNLAISIVDDELDKVKRLSAGGLCDNYFLLTNYTLPAGVAEDAEKRIIASGAKTARIFGNEWIGRTITENPKLRRLVPRIYGLGDLTQIVTHQAYRQAREVLDSIAPDLGCFVPTGAYRQCAHALREHGFVLLLGEPASGKTMIANLMALSAADEWKLQTLMISSPADFSKLWNPDDPGQFLWVDDAFGATQYDANRSSEWNQLLPKLKAAIKSGARVVFTSRNYIFTAAKRDLKISAFELFDDSRVVIQVEKLTDIERQMILYGHLKAGSQPFKFKTDVKAFLEDAAKTPKFLPEIARRFGNPKFTRQLSRTREGVLDFFEKPVKVLFDVVSCLAAAEKAAIGLVFIAGGKLPIPVSADYMVTGTLDLMGVTLGEVKAALISLDDSLLKKIRDGSFEYWTFRHPTIRDAYATLVGSNPELIDVYLAGVSAEQMLLEVSCGTSSIQGSKIIVPPDRYGVVIKKLNECNPHGTPWSDPIKAFLATRCPPELIAEYFYGKDISSCIPQSAWRINPHNIGMMILSSLSRAGLLSNETRQAAANKIIEISEQEYSCRFAVNFGTGGLLTTEEENTTIDNISQSLLENSDCILEELKGGWDRESDPEELFSEVDGTLAFIEMDERFDEDSQQKAASLRNLIKELVRELGNEIEEAEYEKLDTEEAIEVDSTTGRSVFDDVDQ